MQLFDYFLLRFEIGNTSEVCTTTIFISQTHIKAQRVGECQNFLGEVFFLLLVAIFNKWIKLISEWDLMHFSVSISDPIFFSIINVCYLCEYDNVLCSDPNQFSFATFNYHLNYISWILFRIFFYLFTFFLFLLFFFSLYCILFWPLLLHYQNSKHV